MGRRRLPKKGSLIMKPTLLDWLGVVILGITLGVMFALGV
jgi:hypothetical protein